mmetsp:Transcript_10045/g.29747  ORF Transcript_10045/g.29747 Transcript_10045/m.29747 type:complete len:259 (-) Transcript_10045:3489-4265(-)
MPSRRSSSTSATPRRTGAAAATPPPRGAEVPELPKEYLEKSPYEEAGCLSRWSFHFGFPLLNLGAKRPLLKSDLPKLAEEDTAANSTERIWEQWNASEGAPRQKRGRRLLKAIFRAHYWEVIASGVLTFIEGVTIVSQPVLIGPLISWIASDREMQEGYILAAALTVASFAQGIIHHKNFYLTMRWGWHARTGMTGVLHRKLLKVSSAALRGHNDAKAKHIKKKKAAMAGAASVYNLISSDTDRFDSLAPFLHFGWWA